MDPQNDIENDVSPGEGNSSYFEQENLPSYEEAIKAPLAKCTEAPPPTYAEAIGNSRSVFTSGYPYPPPDNDRELAGNRPLCRDNSDLIIVRLLSGLGNDVTSSSHTQHSRPVGQLSVDRVRTGSQPSVYNRSLAKRVQLCFVFIVVAVIIVAGAITTSVIKSTKTDRLSPIEIPKLNIPTLVPNLFHVPKPTKLTYDSLYENKQNSSHKSPWLRESTTPGINWKYYSDKWSKYWRKLQGGKSNRRNSTQRRNVNRPDATTPSDSQVSYAANGKLTLQCVLLSLVLSCVLLFQ